MQTDTKPERQVTRSQPKVEKLAERFSEGCQCRGMRQRLYGGVVMRIASRELEVDAGDEEVKTNVAASGKGRLKVARSVVLLRCMMK